MRLGQTGWWGNDPAKILKEFDAVMNGRRKKGEIPPKWDGKAADRIVHILVSSKE